MTRQYSQTGSGAAVAHYLEVIEIAFAAEKAAQDKIREEERDGSQK